MKITNYSFTNIGCRLVNLRMDGWMDGWKWSLHKAFPSYFRE